MNNTVRNVVGQWNNIATELKPEPPNPLVHVTKTPKSMHTNRTRVIGFDVLGLPILRMAGLVAIDARCHQALARPGG